MIEPFLFPFQLNWGMWGLPEMVCDFYIALDVVCSTSSIFNLMAISIDRWGRDFPIFFFIVRTCPFFRPGTTR